MNKKLLAAGAVGIMMLSLCGCGNKIEVSDNMVGTGALCKEVGSLTPVAEKEKNKVIEAIQKKYSPESLKQAELDAVLDTSITMDSHDLTMSVSANLTDHITADADSKKTKQDVNMKITVLGMGVDTDMAIYTEEKDNQTVVYTKEKQMFSNEYSWKKEIKEAVTEQDLTSDFLKQINGDAIKNIYKNEAEQYIVKIDGETILSAAMDKMRDMSKDETKDAIADMNMESLDLSEYITFDKGVELVGAYSKLNSPWEVTAKEDGTISIDTLECTVNAKSLNNAVTIEIPEEAQQAEEAEGQLPHLT